METIALNVDGLSDSSSVAHISHSLHELDAVADVRVRLREGFVLVEHDPELVTVDEIREALEGAGYEARARAA